MRVFLSFAFLQLCSGIRESESKYAGSVGDIYPSDPRQMLFNWATQDVVDENEAWFDTVLENKAIESFIMEISEIRPGLMITPATAFGIVDNSPYCWVILAYDSSNTALLDGESSIVY